MKKLYQQIRFLVRPVILIASLLTGIYLVLYIEKLRPSDFGFYRDIFSKEVLIERRESYPLRAQSDSLTPTERQYAQIAWNFFRNNYQDSTGFVNSVQYYPSTTLWDVGSYLHGLCSAYELAIIDTSEFDRRLLRILGSMAGMKLFENRLPNKVYDTRTLQMTNYGNAPVETGVGWSSMDIGRFFSFVNRLRNNYPAYGPALNAVLGRWDIPGIIRDGTLQGVMFSTKDNSVRVVQEGKLGYEEYAAKGLMGGGYDVTEAMLYGDFTRFVDILGVDIATDTREVKYYPAYNYITSEPYMLDGLEYGWDVSSRELAYRIFEVQKKRYEKTGMVTAVSEDHLDRAPHFIYNCVYADGEEWNCVTESGDPADELRQLSTKAAFAWWVLFDDPYSDVLIRAAEDLYDPQNGWYSGRYESSGAVNKAITANTNGVILEALNYRINGPLVTMRQR
jgi:hypothetical protein